MWWRLVSWFRRWQGGCPESMNGKHRWVVVDGTLSGLLRCRLCGGWRTPNDKELF